MLSQIFLLVAGTQTHWLSDVASYCMSILSERLPKITYSEFTDVQSCDDPSRNMMFCKKF